MSLSTFRRPVVAAILSLLAIPVARSGQGAESSLTDLDVENSELRLALDALTQENNQLREALSEAKASLIEMRKTLAANAGETEVFRRQALELKRRFEAFGANLSGDAKMLEQRLLMAAGNLQQSEGDKRRMREAMIRLCEAVLRFSKTANSNDAEARLFLEAEVRNANQTLDGGSAEAPLGTPVDSTLTDATVISVRHELSLVVANLGRKHGIKIGMPFQVLRANAIVGTVRVVEVREKFSGAIIQHLSSETDRIKVGDRLRVDTQP